MPFFKKLNFIKNDLNNLSDLFRYAANKIKFLYDFLNNIINKF